jgi:mono/diheme cytochrome c family protein
MNKSNNLFFFGPACLTLTLAVLTLNASPASSAGEEIYKAKCAACHGADASGNTPVGKRMKIRDLRSPEVQKQSDEDLKKIITTGKGSMPGFGKSLDQAKIQDLVDYIRSIGQKS